MYLLEIDNAAHRVFKKLPREVQQEIISRGQILKQNPLQGEPLEGKFRSLRSLHFFFRGTAYRVIYQVFTKTKTIVIRLADKRENIYRRLEEMRMAS